MIQSNNYNNGLPYFIEVRSPLHELKGLGSREIKKLSENKEKTYGIIKELFEHDDFNNLEPNLINFIENYKENNNEMPCKDEIRKELGIGWMKFNELIEKLINYI